MKTGREAMAEEKAGGGRTGLAGKALVPLVIVAILAVTVPLQYLVKKEVVAGLSPESAHSHAHGEEEGGLEHEEGEGEAHLDESDHPASDIPLGTNLIPNYGFEVGTREQIWGWSARPDTQGAVVYRDEGTSFMGLASAAVSTGGNEVIDVGLFMKLDELPIQHDVVFEGHVKTEGLRGRAFIRVIAETKSAESEETTVLFWASSQGVSGSTDWTPQSLRCAIPPEATGVWLEVGLDGAGRAWFDGLSLVVKESGEE